MLTKAPSSRSPSRLVHFSIISHLRKRVIYKLCPNILFMFNSKISNNSRSPTCTSRAGGASSFTQRERARVGSSPMLVISQHRSRKGTPL